MKKPTLIITNLYPLPWQPTRATFNFQQFSLLAEQLDVYILIPVAFPDWYKHKHLIDKTNRRLKIVPYLYLPKFGRRFYGTLMYWSLKALAGGWLRKLKPAKVLASWAYPDGVAAVKIAQSLKADFYLKVHGSDINMHASFPERAKQIVSMANQAKGILSVSQDLADKMALLGVDKSLIKVIYNGVNLTKFVPVEPLTTEKYLLFIGNLKKDKGVIELINAFNIIHKKYPQVRLKYVGSGEMLPQLKQLTSTYDIENKVDFEGVKAHDQLPAILAQAKLLVLPSYNEGVPNVILESMACAVPVVATSVGGIPEILTKECGYLATEITAENIAQNIELALRKEWDREKIRAHAEKFTWQRNIQQLCALLN